MKIPSSSSILLAGLAVSSSSSCLAAPTGDGNQDASMTSSSSASYVSSVPTAYPTGMNAQERSDTITQRDASYPAHLESRAAPAGSVTALLEGLPILGPILAGIMDPVSKAAKSLDVQDSGSDQDQNMDPQQMEALKNAVNEVKRLLQGALGSSLPAPIQGVAGTVNSTLPISPPVNAQSNDDGSGTTSADPSASSSGDSPGPTGVAAAADDGSDPNASASASYSSASATPSSPAAPVNPPNSPALPVNV